MNINEHLDGYTPFQHKASNDYIPLSAQHV